MLVINLKSIGNNPCACSLISLEELPFGIYIYFKKKIESKQIAHTLAHNKNNKHEGRPNQ
jgi:hypothetical protein